MGLSDSCKAELQRLLHDADYRTQIQRELAKVQTRLGTADGVNSMAQLACEMLNSMLAE